MPLINLLTCLLCRSCGTLISAFARKPSSVSCIPEGFCMLCGQTFKHHSSSTRLHLSPLTLRTSDSQLWAAFPEEPWQNLLQQPLAFVVKLATSKMTMRTGALNSKINADKKRMQTYSCAYSKQKLCCLQVLYGWGEKSACSDVPCNK